MQVLNKSMYPYQIPWPKNILNEDINQRVQWIRTKLGNDNWNYTYYHAAFVNSQDAMMYALRWSS